MTHRDTLHRLIKTRGEVLTDYEFRNICLMLYGITHDAEALSDCLIRDASTDGAFLLQGERDALLHVILATIQARVQWRESGCISGRRLSFSRHCAGLCRWRS